MSRSTLSSCGRRALGIATAAVVFSLVLGAAQARAVVIGGNAVLTFDTELLSMNLTGGSFPMPLAAVWEFVDSNVAISLSSQRAANPGPRSLGQATASQRTGVGLEALAGAGQADAIDPNVLDGQPFQVDSFFDVFFDITLTDVDPRPGRDFAGQGDGASFMLLDNGPAGMQSSYLAVFDKNAPSFGLVPPPEASPYVGHFNIEIPLGADLNGNGEADKIKFQLAIHAVGDENRTFIILPDGTVLETFDSAAFLQGALVDLSSDPPFTIGALDPVTGLPSAGGLAGPTTASSRLENPILPEPASAVLVGLGLGALASRQRRRA